MSRSFFRTYGFLSAMLLAIVLGCVLGALWPGATCLAPLGTIFINLMFCIVVPLVFCSLASSIACMKSPKRAGRIMGTTLLVFIVTGLIAALIMLFIVRVYPPVLEPWADAAAGTVDLGDAQLDGLADHLAQIAALGNAGLGRRNEHADALHIDDNAALVLFGDNAFHDLAALNGSLDLFPSLACFQALLGQTDNTLAVVDVNDNSLDLIADLDKILDLGAGICGGELLHGNVSGVLRAEIDFDLIGADRHDGAGDLIPVIQSLEGLLEKLGKILLHCSFNFHFFAHFVVYLLNYPRRS